MSFTNSTEFGVATVNGKTQGVNVETIRAAKDKADSAYFDLLIQLGHFAVWVSKQPKLTAKEAAERMAPKLGYKASSLAPMMSNGKTLVENNATPQKVAQFDKRVKAGKVSTKDGRKARTGLDSFAKFLRKPESLQAATPAKGEDSAPIVDEAKAKAYAEKVKEKESKRPVKVNPFTNEVFGAGDYKFNVTRPKVASDKALQNFRELIAKVEKEYGWTQADLYPTLEKVKA
jgi:hypothetical protein